MSLRFLLLWQYVEKINDTSLDLWKGWFREILTLKTYGCTWHYKAQRFDTSATISGYTYTIISAAAYSMFDQALKVKSLSDKFSFIWCNIDFLLPIFFWYLAQITGAFMIFLISWKNRNISQKGGDVWFNFSGFSRKRKVLISTYFYLLDKLLTLSWRRSLSYITFIWEGPPPWKSQEH